MTILLLDDERTIRKALSFALQKQGYEIIVARNVPEALEMIKTSVFDLLIVDLNIPVVSVIEFLRLLNGRRNKFPCVVLTSQKDIPEELFDPDIKPRKVILKDLPIFLIIEEINSILNSLSGEKVV
jgi:DNA-binding response OmpR family regulator